MKKINIKFQKINKNSQVPTYAYSTDAGMDIFSAEKYLLEPGQNHAFSTGIIVEIPVGYVGLIMEKSGLALKRQISVMGGIIDAGYRGELKVILLNNSNKNQEFKIGDKLAQLLVQQIESVNLIKSDKLSESDRQSGGFGSTGYK